MKNVIFTLLLSLTFVQCFASSKSEQTVNGPPGVCLWAVPKRMSWINLYSIQTVTVDKSLGYPSVYDNVTRISLGTFVISVEIPNNEPIDVHVQSIFKRIAECRNLNSK